MRIIIAGAGDVGFHLAKLLVQENQDIALIDTDAEKLKYASEHLDIATIKGNSISYSILDEAMVSKADLVIAATNSEETNISTCIIAKHLGAKRTIARVRNTEFLLKREKLDLEQLGIDEIISTETLAAREIKRLLKDVAFTDSFEFDRGLLNLIGISIEEESPMAGKTVSEAAYLNPENNFLTVAILRNNKTIIPRGDVHFHIGDHVYFIAQKSAMNQILELSGKKRTRIKNIMILGGNEVGMHTAQKLSLKFNVKLIESDKERCFELADQLRGTLVIHGDGSDVELLEEEGIDQMDAFIAVTDNSETNIISCLVAKNHKVQKTIALVENMDYIHLSQNIGVDTMINKKLIAANFIFRHIRKGEIVTLTSLHGVDAEVVEFEIKESSSVAGKVLRSINFPKSAIVGGVIRNGKSYTPNGDFVFEPMDHVVIVAQPECIHKVESYF
ncbi:Trk system potassium transporter TrkA [Flavobacteriales bacterium]|nr:Trk system potassium transporter TrkA [Flavobacteriales bacterium]